MFDLKTIIEMNKPNTKVEIKDNELKIYHEDEEAKE